MKGIKFKPKWIKPHFIQRSMFPLERSKNLWNDLKKQALVNRLQAIFQSAKLVVIITQQGMTVSETQALRQKVREAGAGYMVTKNRLARLAMKDSAFDVLDDKFIGPTSIFFSEDPVLAAKLAMDFSKENEKIKVLCGASDGRLFALNDVKALAELPGLDELRAKLVGLLQAPAGGIVGIAQAPAGQLARVIGAYANKG